MNRDRWVVVRVTDDELDRIGKRAKAAGLSRSEFIRTRSLTTPESVIQTDADALKALLLEMKRVGTNLNQLAREKNTFGQVIDASRLDTALYAASEASNAITMLIADARSNC